MMKYLIMLLLLMVFINKMNCFCYNLMFFMGFMMLSIKMWNYGIGIMLSMVFMMDYYSYNLVLMSLWIIGLMYMISSKSIEQILFIIMILILMMFFLVKNLLLFYLMFEVSLIPMFVMIVYLGYNLERLSATYYMLMYMLLISLPMLIYIIWLYNLKMSWDFYILEMMEVKLSSWGVLVMIGAFLIKMPMFMFHIWLPKAHVEAPVYGSMVLAAILLKLGSYGLLRIMTIFLSSSFKFMSVLFSVGLIGGVVVSFISLVQVDMKSLVAYSSVVHMNMMLCCLVSLIKLGFLSAYVIMISHGLCSSGLFYMVNLFYSRSSSRLMMLNKGYLNIMPSLMFMWFLLCMSNFSFPLTIGFFGEICLIGTLLSLDKFILMLMVVVMFISSAYSLVLYLYVSHGEKMMLNYFNSGSVSELMISMMHFFPLMILMISMNLF